MPTVLALPVRPAHFAAGHDLAVGTFRVLSVVGGYSVQRTIGAAHWYPLTARENPSWRIWPSFEDASQWMENQSIDLCDYPFWGR